MLPSAKYWLIALAGLLFCQVHGEITITGHDTPLIVGLPRNITCTWSGEMNATKMEWFLAGLGAFPVESATATDSLVLSPDPVAIGLDGTVFTCRVTTTDGNQYEEHITLDVKDLENTVTIQASSDLPLAGEMFTLTCTVVCDVPPQVKWLNPTGQDPTGQGIRLSPQTFNGQTYSLQIHFDPIHTSNTGMYTCISTVDIPPSTQNATRLVKVQLAQPSVRISHEPENVMQLYTTDTLTLTCIVEINPAIDTRVAITSQWSGHSSLTNGGRRVAMSELEGVGPSYSSVVTFTILKSVDSGTYVCSAKIVPQENLGTVLQSNRSSDTVSISVGINVTIDITYNPPSDFTLPSPPYYRPATSVTLTCHAHNATGSVTYQWSSTCTSCFASSRTSQSVRDSILTSTDAGVHTCTVTDQDENTGKGSTQMQLIGAGIYVSSSQYVSSSAVANNTYVVSLSQSCTTCTYYRRGYCQSYSGQSCTQLSLYCYSNSTSSSVRYLVWPNGNRYHVRTNYYYVDLSQQNPGGLYIRNNFNYRPYGGVYTCRMPDSNDNIVEMSIAMYSSQPSAPQVQAINFTNLLGDFSGDMSSLATVTCSTRNSPPTNVTWMKDGEELKIDGVKYRALHEVTDRSNSYYDVKLIIGDIIGIGGDHSYTCMVNNSRGGHWKTINTSVSVWSESVIHPMSEPVHGQNFTMSCVTILQPKLHRLSQHIVLEWVGPDGVPLTTDNNITIGPQITPTISSLQFSTVDLTHHGLYICRATLNLPNTVFATTTSSEHYLSVLDHVLIQLKFSPIIHCNHWYRDSKIATHLENNIKETIVNVIESNCNCNFAPSMINHGEFSCQTSSSGVTYRARITGTSETLSAPEILAHIQDWLTNDGTFLYTYHARIRLRANPDCPLKVRSFSEPECRSEGHLDEEEYTRSTHFAPHGSFDEL